MDVTPQVINEVEFHQKMRGYDPDEVDDFLERVAVAVEQLQSRTREAEQRAIAAERRAEHMTDAAKSAPVGAAPARASEADDTEAIRRTLVLAQRTADAAIKEAEEEAKRTLDGAHDQVQRLHAEAQDHARKLVIAAESDARKAADETRQRLVKEIISLEETRDALRADQGILERHLDEQRLRLRSSIGELQRLLDDPGRLRMPNPPELSGVARPDLVDEVVAEVSAVNEDPADADATVIDLEGPSTEIEGGDVERRRPTGGVTFTPPEEGNGETEPTARDAGGRVAVLRGEGDEDAWAMFAKRELDGPPTMAVDAVEAGDDVYLTELRKAMLTDTSASTLDPDEHRARTRFGRRR
jgi:DivIVA domain-containing protein